jgi:hypothetical protein
VLTWGNTQQATGAIPPPGVNPNYAPAFDLAQAVSRSDRSRELESGGENLLSACSGWLLSCACDQRIR